MSPKDVVRRLSDGVTPLTDVDAAQVLDLDTIEHEEAPALIARGAAYVREYAAVEKKPTILAMNIATVLLALRRRHGDMEGKSHDYRMEANEVYNLANIPDDQRSRLQANVRYHIGNMLRRVLTTRELRSIGLLDTSPLERLQDRRATDSAILKATKVSAEVAASTPKTPKPTKGKAKEVVPQQGGGAGTGVKATADHLRLVTVARNLVGQLSADVIDESMTDGQRAKLDEELAAIAKTITELRKHTRKRRSGA